MEETPLRRDVPLWLGLGLMVIGLVAGGWFVYGQLSDYVAGKPHSFLITGVNAADYVNMRPSARSGGGSGRHTMASAGGMGTAGGIGGMGDEVRAIGKDAIRVRAGAMMLNITDVGGAMTIAGSLLNAAVLHPDYTITQLLKSHIHGDGPAPLTLTEAQKDLLRKVQGSPMTYPLHFDESEVELLKPLVLAWHSAPEHAKAGQASTLLAAVRKLAPAKTAAAKAGAAAEVSAFRASVSDETWQQIRQVVTSGGN